MSVKKRPVAVFDVDGTIFRSSLFIQLVERMVRNGIFPVSVSEHYKDSYKKWLDRVGTYEKYISSMVEAFKEHLKGVHYGDFSDSARQVVSEQSKRTYKYTTDLIKELKSSGHFLLAVSHSPKTILDLFCPTLGFDKVYGMVYEIGAEDCLTGGIVDAHIMLNKAMAVKRAVEKENLTFENSFGVGDTEADISFLELVENPICFNPNSSLNRIAKLNKWQVVVERKDVIYNIIN